MEVVTGALPSLLPKLADLLKEEYNLQKEVKGGIRFLQTELETMKAALEEISKTPGDKLNKVDKIWARDVRELSYDIEDKIDTFVVRCKGSSRQADQHGLKKAVDRSLNWLTKPKIRRKMATEIRDIKSRVLEVHERHRRYESNNRSVDHKPVEVDSRALVRYEDVTKLVGIDEARDEVINILIKTNEVSSSKQDKIVSIYGFGGLGKTTLANLVYEKLRGENFDCSAFVSVSQTPNMKILFNDLMHKFGIPRNNTTSISSAIDTLSAFLQEKRYFVVIDDIWDTSVWKHIRYALPANSNGCKIITTTRILEVAEEIGDAYKMKPLSLHSSRILLYRRIFGHADNDKVDGIEEVSNKILKKCGGVPLAIITIASLLKSKGANKLDWYDVCNFIGTGMEDNANVENMRKVLSLSYYNMPSHIRTCLLYLGVFPEDHEIDTRSLIWLWIAEGFIQNEKQGRSLFEVGESYVNELVNRSMIQPVYAEGMEIVACRVHDMVLDLICSLSREENFVTTSLNDRDLASPAQKVVRRLSLQNGKVDGGAQGASIMSSMEQVRSVVVFPSAVNLMPALSRFEVVRVLQLGNCNLSGGHQLKHIGKLVHLRFLGLRSTGIVELPEEIGNLQFLQTLDISDNNGISTLPSTVFQLRQLKCLYIGYRKIEPVSTSIGRLTSLEELSSLRIDGPECVEELCHLTELRVLHISYIDFDDETDGHVLAKCLNKLHKMEALYIKFGEFGEYRRGSGRSFEGWVDGHRHLRSLMLGGYRFSKLPDWMKPSDVGNLSSLRITVRDLKQEDLETLARFPALRFLDVVIPRFDGVSTELLVIAAGSFPCLVRCKLGKRFGRVVFRQGAMPMLTSLELDLSYEAWSAWTTGGGIPDEWGFQNLPSLLDLQVGFAVDHRDTYSVKAFLADKLRAVAALRKMAEIHPNHPIICYTLDPTWIRLRRSLSHLYAS